MSASPDVATASAALGWIEMPVSNQSVSRLRSAAHPASEMTPPAVR